MEFMGFHADAHSIKVFLVLLVIILAGRVGTLQLYRRRKQIRGRDNFVLGINNVTTLLLLLWLFFLVLHLVGITIREFFTSITIIAAALSIVFKDYILNGLNGMILMFGDNLHIGDYVKVHNHKGKIDNITLLNVHLQSDEDDLIIIPNNTFINSEIINYSKNPRQYSSIDFEVQSAQSVSAAELEKLLISALEPENEKIREGTVRLRVVEFRNDLVHYRFRFGLKEYDPKDEAHIKQRIWREILNLVKGQNKIL
ncbi:MAG: mechanosensitive ion channel [Bacteroidetes bacterium]|nr:mechanosensitive ion channel [Bacteroidota bacterium]